MIDELGVTDMKGMGPVMKRMTADLRGQADGQVRSIASCGSCWPDAAEH